MSTLPTNDGRRSPSLYSKEAVVLQVLCKQPSIPGLHKRSQLSNLPRLASHFAASKQRPHYSADSIRPSKASILLSSHIISSYSAQVSVQKVPPKNTPSEYWVPYPALDGRRTRGIKSYQCRVCQEIHPLRKCDHFLRLSPPNRLQEVHIQKYCSNCLAHNHSKDSCRSGHHCHKCGKAHHTLLHMDDQSSLPTYS